MRLSRTQGTRAWVERVVVQIERIKLYHYRSLGLTG